MDCGINLDVRHRLIYLEHEERGQIHSVLLSFGLWMLLKTLIKMVFRLTMVEQRGTLI